MRSPDPNMQNRGVNNGYQQNGKRESALAYHALSHALTASAPAGYYGPGQDLSQQHPYPAHPAHMAGNQQFNYAPQQQQQPQQQYSGYGQVNYPTSNTLGDLQSMDTRKRAIEALNDFLGDIKRRAIDPGNYYDVGQRLQSQNLPLPISTGFGYSTGSTYGGNSSYSGSAGLMDSYGGSTAGMMGGSGGAMAQGPLTQSYSLPMPHARTKNDLQDIDRFLEQLQATVYENSNSAAAAGVQQPGVHSQHTFYPGFNNHYRTSDSPPNTHQVGSSASGGVVSLNSVANMANMGSAANTMDTPALTPASVTSYASSSHSPLSTHSRASMSSVNGNSMYPSLPAVTAVPDMSGYPTTTSAPASGLASGFDAFEGRRYSGGRLQREAPVPKTEPAPEDAMDMDSDGAKTPRNAKEAERPESSSLDPALRSTPVPTQSAVQSPDASTANSSDGDKSQEAWVENIRVIESLRSWIRERLDRQEYEADESEQHVHHAPHEEQPDPIHQLREENEKHDAEQVAYPLLKTEA